MSLYIKLYTNFWTHRKTAKLRSLIGNDAFWIPQRLWSYAAENQPDGDFSSYNEIELAMLIGYNGDATSMLKALQQASFMDGMKIHDWNEHNEYHHTFSERAKNAAQKRWEKKGEDKTGEDKIRDKHSFKHATSIFIKPTAEEVEEYGKSIGYHIDGHAFVDHYTASGWLRGKTPIKDWKACVRTWKAGDQKKNGSHVKIPSSKDFREAL